MPDNDVVTAIFEALLEQTRAIRDVKVQTESLKQMMFEHRPAFVPSFDEQVRKVTTSPALQDLNTMIARLQEAVQSMRAAE